MQKTSKSVRWGIAGAGPMAELFAEGLARAPCAQVVAVASRTPARAAALARRLGSGHSSYEALATNPEVDVVYVATPNADHCDRARMMLEAGKPVVCEKPFAMNANEAREVVALARKKRLFCMEAMWMRFIPAVEEIAFLTKRGAIGEPRAATIELGHPMSADAPQRRLDAKDGGGALLDLGPYVVSLAHMLLGPVVAVQSQATFGPSGADEHVTALLAHEGHRQSAIAVSVASRLANSACVVGTEGRAVLHEPIYRSDAITWTRAPAPRSATEAGSGGIRAHLEKSAWLRGAVHRLRSAVPFALRGGGKRIVRPYRGNGYTHEAVHVMECLDQGLLESPVMPTDETLRVMETLDAVRAAARRA